VELPTTKLRRIGGQVDGTIKMWKIKNLREWRHIMTRLEILRTLYQTGFILQLGHRAYSLHPLHWVGRLYLRWIYRKPENRKN